VAELVQRTCDWKVGRAKTPCGNRVKNDQQTEFVIDGVTYAMDVCEDHYSLWLGSNGPALDIATPIASKKASNALRAVMKGNRTAFTTKDVREWLRSQGQEVPDSGRLPNDAIEAYKAAH
jgi:hypothetical protein